MMNGMVFSLSIITILALAFVGPSVMAGEFGVSLDMSGDISHAEGLQLQDATTIALTIEFDEAVVLVAADHIAVSNYDADGVFLPSTTAPTVNPTTVANEIAITITPATDAARVSLGVMNGIASADPFNADTSAEGQWDIGLLAADPSGGPDVLKIALVGEPFETITTATFQVHVLLSEKPKDGFTANLLDVTNATGTSVVRLVSPGSSATVNGRTVRASWRDHNLHSYLVTFETQLGEKTVTIKIENFAGMEKPTDTNTQYVRPPDSALVEGRDILTLKTNRDSPRAESVIVRTPEDTIPHMAADAVPTPDNQEADASTAGATENVKAETTATTEAADTSVSIPEDGRVYISEIMFAGGGFLPQWIEIANGSRTEQVNLSGWTLTVENETANLNAFVRAKAKFRIPKGTRIDPSGQHDTPSTLLVVAKRGRTNLDGKMAAGQVVNLNISRPRYALLSDTAFKITLFPPGRSIVPEQVAARAAATDVVGNLAGDGTAMWALPINERGARSSMIRRHVPVSMGPGEPKDGTMMESWMLASETEPAQPKRLGTHSYYGFSTDVGTPGFRAGGAVPVELSHFRSARDKQTGAVVITWSTQSELNNTGFFIRRSQQRDGPFEIINATMVLGAGTTSEKRFYTYTDTTAQPNVVYYYQIEDVSLDGQRQTLTRGIRLKGHVGAAGKATVIWGELKTSHE